MIELSFIIPVYNVEKYIARCLDSIYALPMKMEQYEVLCIDDCSPDGSVAIIENYQKQYPNLRLIHHEHNHRQGAARNTGVREAQGEYCMFVDADDSLPKVDVAHLIAHMRANDIELLLGKAQILTVDRAKSVWGNPPAQESSIMCGPDIFVNEEIHRIAFGVVWLAIYKMELVRRIPPFQEDVYYEDTDWTLRCAYEARRLQYMPVLLYNYHINPASTTTTKSIKSIIERMRQALRVYEWALTTTERHNEVVYAVEDYGTWNLRGLSSIVKYGYSDRRTFYHAFTHQQLCTIAHWKGGNYTQLYVRFPILSQIALCILHPCYVVYKSCKKILKQCKSPK